MNKKNDYIENKIVVRKKTDDELTKKDRKEAGEDGGVLRRMKVHTNIVRYVTLVNFVNFVTVVNITLVSIITIAIIIKLYHITIVSILPVFTLTKVFSTFSS